MNIHPIASIIIAFIGCLLEITGIGPKTSHFAYVLAIIVAIQSIRK